MIVLYQSVWPTVLRGLGIVTDSGTMCNDGGLDRSLLKNIFIMKRLFVFFAFFFVSLNGMAQYDLEPLKVGDDAPNFVALDQHGNSVELASLLKMNEHVVMVFYRGAWCGYCKEHASVLQDSLQFVMDEGAAVVMITPEKGEAVDKMVEKTGATFSVLHDAENKIMTDYGVAYGITEETVPKFFKYVVHATRKGTESEDDVLPVPATYVIGKDGKVRFVHYDQDYSQRTTVAEILGVLER